MDTEKKQIEINCVKYEIRDDSDNVIANELPNMEEEIGKLENYFNETWEAEVDISIHVKKFRNLEMLPTELYTWLGIRKVENKEANEIYLSGHIEKYIEEEMTNAMINRAMKLGFRNNIAGNTVEDIYDSCDDDYELIIMGGKVKIELYIAGIDEFSIKIYELKNDIWIEKLKI